MKKIFSLIISTAALLTGILLFSGDPALAAEGTLLGNVTSTKPASNEVNINASRASELLKIGDRVYVRVDGKAVVMRVTFPMQSTARCLVEPKYQSKTDQLRKGMLVYRYFAGVEGSESRGNQPSDPQMENLVKTAIIAFEQYVPWSDVDQGFRYRQAPWHQDVRAASSPAVLGGFLVEFENWILRDRFAPEWESMRQSWKDKTRSSASYSDVNRQLEELRRYYQKR